MTAGGLSGCTASKTAAKLALLGVFGAGPRLGEASAMGIAAALRLAMLRGLPVGDVSQEMLIGDTSAGEGTSKSCKAQCEKLSIGLSA